ncbi:vitamin K epoxide reductase family protein [Pyrinomonas sp.]|uniref:vitamin K epoxide reductase family protein n=1 Tax=Pyrinomonas sp. TaxID=2080306 RepID=UPI0033238419
MNNSLAEARRSTTARLLALMAMVSLVGLGDAVYLTVEHLSGRTARCTVLAGCSAVLGSEYAKIGSVPLAAIGAVAYFSVFSLATLAAFGYETARRPLFALVFAMLGVTLWLLYLQAFILRAFCEYCLLSAAVTLTLSGLAVLLLRRSKTSQ